MHYVWSKGLNRVNSGAFTIVKKIQFLKLELAFHKVTMTPRAKKMSSKRVCPHEPPRHWSFTSILTTNMSSPDLRQRAGKPENKTASSDAKVKAIVAKEDTGISLVDILRVLAGLLLLNVTLSYFITNDSFFWGNRPSWTRPAKAVAIVTQYLVGLPQVPCGFKFLLLTRVVEGPCTAHRCGAPQV